MSTARLLYWIAEEVRKHGRVKVGELWHRDVVACWNLFFKALGGDGSIAPSPRGLLPVDGSPVPLGSTATHEPIEIQRSLWARWKSLDMTMNGYEVIGMNIQGQTRYWVEYLEYKPKKEIHGADQRVKQE